MTRRGTCTLYLHYVRTHPLEFQHTLSECLALLHMEVPRGNLSHVNNTVLPLYDVPRGRNGPSTQLIEATSCVERWNTAIKAKEFT